MPFVAVFVLYNAAVGVRGATRSSYTSSVAPVCGEATTPSVPSAAMSGYYIVKLTAAMPLAGL